MTRSASSRAAARATTNAPSTPDPETITAEEFDRLADSGVDIEAYIDHDKAIRPGRAVQRVNVDFPTELLRAIDREATRIGVSRQAFIKLRLADLVTPSIDTITQQLNDYHDRIEAKIRKAVEREHRTRRKTV